MRGHRTLSYHFDLLMYHAWLTTALLLISDGPNNEYTNWYLDLHNDSMCCVRWDEVEWASRDIHSSRWRSARGYGFGHNAKKLQYSLPVAVHTIESCLLICRLFGSPFPSSSGSFLFLPTLMPIFSWAVINPAMYMPKYPSSRNRRNSLSCRQATFRPIFFQSCPKEYALRVTCTKAPRQPCNIPVGYYERTTSRPWPLAIHTD